MTSDFGLLHLGALPAMVRVKHEYADRWLAYREGRWRRVHIQVRRTYIVYQGEKITITIDGV